LKDNMKKYKIKGFKKPISICTCCNLEYSCGNILGGLTISLTKKDNPENYSIIDIPYKELKNLRLVINDRIKRGK